MNFFSKTIFQDYELLTAIAKLVLAYSKMHEENRSDSMMEGTPQILCKGTFYRNFQMLILQFLRIRTSMKTTLSMQFEHRVLLFRPRWLMMTTEKLVRTHMAVQKYEYFFEHLKFSFQGFRN